MAPRCVGRIGISWKCNDLRPRGQGWLKKPALDPFGNAMHFEDAAPWVGPESHTARFNLTRNIRLRIAVLRQKFGLSFQHAVQQVGVAPHREAIDRGIADPFVRLCPIATNDEVSTIGNVVEKAVDIACYYDVQIQKERLAAIG